jgi:5'-3' exonuclease
MGIKQFFKWIQTKHTNSLRVCNKNEVITGVHIDNLHIDMNGLFHDSAQYIYRYGKYPTDKYIVKDNYTMRKKYVKHVCDSIIDLVEKVGPKKKLVLCVDGCAPVSKQNQMRARRMGGNEHVDKGGFDSNNLSVGTYFMSILMSHINGMINLMITNDKKWGELEVIFSTDKACGEGEHKLNAFIKAHPNESHCFYGLDADLIMLSLITHVKRVYILRDNLYPNGEAEKNTWFLVDIDLIRSNLLGLMKWENSDDTNTINDFVFICFMIGNDFLPHIPEIEIISGGIEFMIEQYNVIGAKHGHMTKQGKISTKFNKDALVEFITLISNNEGVVISEKVGDSRYFEDAIAKKYATLKNDEYVVDMTKYKAEYNSVKIGGDISKVCDHYLDGLNWVLNYYISGTVDWDWYYPNHYAPFASDLLKQIPIYEFKHNRVNKPVDILLQLASIIPERNANFLPTPLRSLIAPDIAVVKDFSGVRREWEAVSLIPFLDRQALHKSYTIHKTCLNDTDSRINTVVPAYIYKKSDKVISFKTLYDGEIKSMAQRSKYEF